MPPKRLAHLQALRDTFTEADSCAIIERWATETIINVEKLSQQAAQQKQNNNNNIKYNLNNALQTPEAILHILQEYQTLCHNIFMDVDRIRSVILIRVPELKEEDNLGVAVQHNVLKMLDELQNKTCGGNSSNNNSDKSASFGINAPAGMFTLKEYLSTRGSIEEKILGKSEENNNNENNNNNNNNNKGGSKSPSLLLELKQVDMDIMLKVELAATILATALRAFVSAYALNWKKLIQPRSGGDHMVS